MTRMIAAEDLDAGMILVLGSAVSDENELCVMVERMTHRDSWSEVVGVAARTIQKGELIEYSPIVNTMDVLIRSNL